MWFTLSDCEEEDEREEEEEEEISERESEDPVGSPRDLHSDDEWEPVSHKSKADDLKKTTELTQLESLKCGEKINSGVGEIRDEEDKSKDLDPKENRDVELQDHFSTKRKTFSEVSGLDTKNWHKNNNSERSQSAIEVTRSKVKKTKISSDDISTLEELEDPGDVTLEDLKEEVLCVLDVMSEVMGPEVLKTRLVTRLRSMSNLCKKMVSDACTLNAAIPKVALNEIISNAESIVVNLVFPAEQISIKAVQKTGKIFSRIFTEAVVRIRDYARATVKKDTIRTKHECKSGIKRVLISYPRKGVSSLENKHLKPNNHEQTSGISIEAKGQVSVTTSMGRQSTQSECYRVTLTRNSWATFRAIQNGTIFAKGFDGTSVESISRCLTGAKRKINQQIVLPDEFLSSDASSVEKPLRATEIIICNSIEAHLVCISFLIHRIYDGLLKESKEWKCLENAEKSTKSEHWAASIKNAWEAFKACSEILSKSEEEVGRK